MQRGDLGRGSFQDIQNDLVAAAEAEEEEIEVVRQPLPTRICLASARFAVNSILCGSFGGYGLNALLLYSNNDPVQYSETMWGITTSLYLSPFLAITRGVEYTAEISTVLVREQPTTLADVRFMLADNMPLAIEHMMIDTGLLALTVMLYLQNVEDPDLLELCLLNCIITLARNIVEVPLNFVGRKILSLDALEGFRNCCLFAPARRPQAANVIEEIDEEKEEYRMPHGNSNERFSNLLGRDYGQPAHGLSTQTSSRRYSK